MPTVNSNNGQKTFDGSPDRCPFCHKIITPTHLHAYQNGNSLELMMICPNLNCKRSFIAYYNSRGTYFSFNGQTTQGSLIGKTFSDTISSISPAFVIIYNQAFSAEQQSLTEICGVGFRKALEFLIKDYIILSKPTDKEKVEKKLLGACISEYVTDSRIKAVAKRAVWIGNDETHYVRKWDGKNLDDLKKLIELTLHWIEMEALTKTFELEMPEV